MDASSNARSIPHLFLWLYVAEAIRSLGIFSTADLQFFWLPLAHVFGKTIVGVCIDLGIPTAVDSASSFRGARHSPASWANSSPRSAPSSSRGMA